MKKMLLLLLALCLPFELTAQTELDQIINVVQHRYLKLSSFSAEFTQLYVAPGERLRRESGRMLLKKPGRMRWDYHSPEARLYLADGKTMYEYVPSERVAMRTRLRDSADIRAPFLFLLGRGNLRRDFTRIELDAEAPINAGNRVLRLIPKRNQEFRELLIELTPKDYFLARLSFIDQHGGRTDFIFSSVRENIPIEDSLFVFKPPAGVQVIDQ